MRGDAVAKQVFERVGRALGLAIANMVNALNLPLFVIGGGVSSAWDAFSPALFDEVRQTVVHLCLDDRGRWQGSRREAAHDADHAGIAGRRRRTFRGGTIADAACGGSDVKPAGGLLRTEFLACGGSRG